MKIFGHPIHLMLIHFPSALFPMECICYGLLYFTGKSSFGDASFYAMLGGVSMGWLAVLFGILDLSKLSSEKAEIVGRGLVHGSINGAVLIVYTVIAYSLFKKYPDLPHASGLLLVAKVILVLLLFVGNYIGGNLVLKYKVGVEK